LQSIVPSLAARQSATPVAAQVLNAFPKPNGADLGRDGADRWNHLGLRLLAKTGVGVEKLLQGISPTKIRSQVIECSLVPFSTATGV
jgi:hypothetical protein